LADLPLRVSRTEDDRFEVVDGFKRLEKWRALGLEEVPVVVERLRSSIDEKVTLLIANRPPRTLTPMDEARVVYALRHEEGLGPKTIARVCGQKPSWVYPRLTLAERLSSQVANRVDAGTVGVTLAHALCSLNPEGEQEAVYEAIDRHGLKGHEALALVSAYRLAETPQQRSQLLSEPHAAIRPQQRTASVVGALASHIEEKLRLAREALVRIANFSLPDEGLSSAERRRLDTEHRSLLYQLYTTAQALAMEHLSTPELTHEEMRNATEKPAKIPSQKETCRDNKRRPRQDCESPQDGFRDAAHKPEDRIGSQSNPRCSGGDGSTQDEGREHRDPKGSEQAGPVSHTNPAEGRQRPDRDAYPARDQQGGLQRRTHDFGQPYPPDSQTTGSEKEGMATFRNSSRRGDPI